jgi:ABC-type branched-subunit amino acid transport system ATPase component/branched-subunit amino acid ABC-type transport system permease component
MSTHLAYLLIGLGPGAIYALLGIGLVVEYQVSGVVNFAQGAMAMLVAYEFVQLRTDGAIVFPVVGLPDRWHLTSGTPVGSAPSVALSLAYAAVLGLLVYLLVQRPLRHRPPTARAVASVGVTIVCEGLVLLHFGSTSRSTGTLLPTSRFHVGGLVVPGDRLYLAGVVIVIAAGLWALFRFTRFGIAARAVADSEKGVALTGYSPDLLAGASWVLGTVLAGAAGILIAPIRPLDPGTYTLLVIPALACALAGRFRSIVWTLVAGLGLGAISAEVTHVQVDHQWVTQLAIADALPLVVIVALLVGRGRGLPARGEAAPIRLPRPSRPRVVGASAAAGGLAGVIGLVVLHGGYRAALIQSLVSAIIAMSLIVLVGFCGQISLAQMSLAGIAGFAYSQLTASAGLPFPIAAVSAVILTVPFGIVIGLPALRLRGIEYGIVTIAGAVVFEELVFRWPALVGSLGSAAVPQASVFGHSVGRASLGFGIVVLGLAVSVGVVVARVRQTRWGRAMLAVRNQERAAASLGVSVARTKLGAFALSSAIAGIGGVALGYEIGQLSSDSFRVLVSLGLLALVYAGGVTMVSGAIAMGVLLAPGALVPTIIQRHVDITAYQLLLLGAGLIGAMLANDSGIASGFVGALERLRLRRPPLRTRSVPMADIHTVRDRGLEIESLTVRFGSTVAVDRVNLRVPPGRIVGLIGPNGAGKTSLIDAATGFVAAAEGRVRFGGEDISALAPHRRASRGLTRTFQFDELFDDLTVWENALVAADAAASSDPEGLAAWALDVAGVEARDDVFAEDLTPAARKALSLARALCTRPSVLILDEPSSGLDRAGCAQLGRQLEGLVRRAGVGILVVDHNVSLVLRCCDEVVVLDAGRVIARGSPEAVRADPGVAAAYLGGAFSA